MMPLFLLQARIPFWLPDQLKQPKLITTQLRWFILFNESILLLLIFDKWLFFTFLFCSCGTDNSRIPVSRWFGSCNISKSLGKSSHFSRCVYTYRALDSAQLICAHFLWFRRYVLTLKHSHFPVSGSDFCDVKFYFYMEVNEGTNLILNETR